MSKKIITFKNDAEMVHKLPDIDRNHWANKIPIHLLKKKVFENTEQTVVYYPSFLDEKTYPCSNCKTNAKPDWLAKRMPILPYVTKNGLYLKLSYVTEKCTNCNHDVEIEIPYVPHVGLRKMYGDEALRFVDNKVILSYTFIGEPVNSDIKAQMLHDFLKLKKELVPSIPPTSWVLHFTELWSTDKRKRNKHTSSISETEVIEFANKIGALLKAYEKDIDIFNATGVFEKPQPYKGKEEQLLKSRVYSPLIFNCIYRHTMSGYSPHMFFEKTGNDGWAKNLFKGGMLTLAWPFICNSNPMPQPEFVSPTHDFLLEIADFISFVIARYLYQIGSISKGECSVIDINPEVLGWINYTGFQNNGTSINHYHNKYPIKHFFSGTSWVNNQIIQ